MILTGYVYNHLQLNAQEHVLPAQQIEYLGPPPHTAVRNLE